MEKKYFSTDVGKIVLRLDGAVLGVVKSAVLSDGYKRRVGAVCFEQDGEEFTYRNENVFRIGEDAVVLRESPTPPSGNVLPSPVGKSAFSLDGKALGRLSDIVEQNGKVIAFVTETGEYAIEKVVAIGGAVLIDVATPRTKLPAKKKTAENKAQEGEGARCGEQLLIGRKVKRAVFNQKGECLAREGELITREILEEVKKYGKLYDLTVGSLSNIL